ncbi:MAG: hypothetical protein PVF58_18120 [Candidatus Methanofastidiosia archaeon]
MTSNPVLIQPFVTDLFKKTITELQKEPQFNRYSPLYAVSNGDPSIKVAVGNVPLNYDLWKGLRNPGRIGLYPAGLKEIWEFYAHRSIDAVDASGRPTIFQVPVSFQNACTEYKRAVLISVMLPFAPDIVTQYINTVEDNLSSSHLFTQIYNTVDTILDTACTRVAHYLVHNDTVVVPMNNQNVSSLSAEAIPLTRQNDSHGPSKGGNYPQKSLAVLLGLGQLGVHRIVFRDEIKSGKVHRYIGPLRSIIVFDKNDVTTDGLIIINEKWRKFLFKLFDYTNTNPDINKYRFCTYIPLNDQGCGLCTEYCPSGAQPNSMPLPTGKYSTEVSHQNHRFWEGVLQFDHARCCQKRGQMKSMFPEWSCARGLSVCASKGKKRKDAVQNFYEKMDQLTSG